MNGDRARQTKVLSIGIVVGGYSSQSKIWQEALMCLSRAVVRLRDQLESDLRINIEFQVPGHILSPEFEGLRLGRFRKVDALLKVQVAVPINPPDDPYSFAVRSMQDAIDMVEVWSIGRRMSFNAGQYRELIDLLDSTLPE